MMTRSSDEKERQTKDGLAEPERTMGSNLARIAELAVEFVIEKTGIRTESEDVDLSEIAEHMDVIASCGKKIGVVDELEPSGIKLTRKDGPDNRHHYIPLDWIVKVDHAVHLNRNSKEATFGWQSSDAGFETGCK